MTARLVVRRARRIVWEPWAMEVGYRPGWDWTVVGPDREIVDAGHAPTWHTAHVIGHAALDTAHVGR